MRSATILLSILSLLLISTCVTLYAKTRRDAAAMDALKLSEQALRTRYDQVVQEISAIQDSLNAIAADAAQGMELSSLGAERRLSPTGASEALARIAGLRTRLQSLESRLQQSDIQIVGLDNLVKQLKRGLAAREQMVARLGHQVDSLQTDVGDLTTSVEKANALIAAQAYTLEVRRRELGTVYYAAGTRRELMQAGVVVARGGVLGMGKTLGPSNAADPAAFHAVDTDEESVIPLTGTKARVLTAQPAESYSIESVNGRLELHILDPQAFRKVKRLVIVTA